MKVSAATLLVSVAVHVTVSRADVAFNASTTTTIPHRHLSAQAMSCSLQSGIDFVGNDIASVSGVAAAGDCCSKCSAQTGCGAFTWTSFNGGTCWLKSAKGATVANAGAQSAEVSSSLGSCSLESGVDYVNNDIGSVSGVSAASACCAKCSARSGCGAFTWTNWNGGTCWLKSGKGATVANAGAYSSVVGTTGTGVPPTTTPPSPAPVATASCPAVEPNVDYPGADIANVPGTGTSDCCAKCTAHAGCGAFTWTNFNGGTCWLKSTKGASKALQGAVSAVIGSAVYGGGASPSPTATPYPTPTSGGGLCPVVEDNIDYPGSDIANIPGSGAGDCCAKCSQRTGCGAFTWTSFNGGTCWLKSAKGTATPLVGAISAVLTGATTTTPPTTALPLPTVSPSYPTTAATHIQPRLRSGELPLRSVNLGGWLVGENWMSLNSPAWTDAGEDAAPFGEYVTMQKLGKDKGTRQFEQHRATWITETDIQQIAAAGLNAVRVPVGFWIVNDDQSTVSTAISRVYAPGGLKYLDKLINEWAVTYNLAVILSLHAHQGSQNGYDHSAPQVFGGIAWSSSQANVDNSLQFATFLATRYQNSTAFLGMNLMNEPMFPTDITVVQAYYKEAYRRIRATGNDCVLVTSPLLWNQMPPVMMDFMRAPAYTNVWHEFHTYFRWTHEGKTEQQILDTARPYRQWAIDPWTGNPLHLGEWSLAGPDSAPFQDKAMLRQYAAIQLTNYAAATAGWSFWSWRHDEETTKLSGWSLRQLLKENILTIPRVN